MSMDRLSRWAAWANVIQLPVAALALGIAILLFVDPNRRAVEWLHMIKPYSMQDAMFVLLCLAVFFGLLRLRSIGRALAEDRPTLPRDGPQLVVVSQGTDTTSVRLGEREVDFGPGAYEYFERQREADREKILRRLRRSDLQLRWNKEDLEMVIDEKRRVHIKLDQFLSSAYSIKREIESERHQKESVPKPIDLAKQANTFLGLALPPLLDYEIGKLIHNVWTWRNEVYDFLQREVKGHAEEFRRDIPPPAKDTDRLGVLLHTVQELEERLVQIKSRVS